MGIGPRRPRSTERERRVSPEARLRILGPEAVAEIHRYVATVPPPDAETVEEIRQIFAPAVQRLALKRAAAQHRTAA